MSLYDKLNLVTKHLRINKVPEALKTELAACPLNLDLPTDVVLDTIVELDDLTCIANSFLSETHVKNKILYILYPKKRKPQAIHRDTLIQKGLVLGLKAVKLISANDDYSCMGFKCLEAVKTNKTKRPSQCVNDYQDKVTTLKTSLSLHQAALQFYTGLTLGYQKDWARYIYSAVKSETQQRRFEEMCQAFALGCKSIDLYKARLKQS